MNERPKLDKLLNIALELTGVSFEQLIGFSRSSRINICRGIYLMLCYEFGYRVRDASKLIHRSRSSCVTTTNRYLGYYAIGDKLITKYFKDAIKVIRNG